MLLAVAVLAAGCTLPTGHDPVPPDEGGRKAPVWATPLPDDVGAPLEAALAGDAVVVRAEHGVAVLDAASGAIRWRHSTGTATAGVTIARAGIVLGAKRGSARVLDLATGADRATVPGTLAAATADSAYTIEATTAGNTVTAVDPATGRPRWTRTLPGHGSAEVARGVTALQGTTPASLPVVTTESAHSRITFLATATGAVIATRDTQDPRGVELAAPGIVLAHDPAARNCPVLLQAYDARTGAEAWQRRIGQWRLSRTGDTPSCTTPGYVTVAGDSLLTLDPDEHPQLAPLDTGQPAWTGAAGDYPIAVAGPVVVTRTCHGTGPLTGIDLTTGKIRWSTPFDGHDTNPAGTANQEFALSGTTLYLTLDRLDPIPGAAPKVQVAYAMTAIDTATGRRLWTTTPSIRLCGTAADGAFGCQSAGPSGGDYRNEVHRYR
ncbi:outer membrane protein assembly factor BamB [Dactylosporangium darangshiense]|uniref:Outer membrane protein assembly factor BamB n=1 Tax=Dactylosporangium darangshiense TaxID=579108 RepID=A0ABP8DUX8_9ACTN